MSQPDQNRIPPGQQLVAPGKWPIIGERQPADSSDPWCLEICGLVERPLILSLDELQALPQTQTKIDIHCVTRWSRLDARFSGVLLADILDRVRPSEQARYVSFVARSQRDHSTSLSLQDALKGKTLIALTADNRPLAMEHGGPIRNIVEGKYFYKSVKWLKKIELLAVDRLGYWEAETGYHNGADPWLEQRYMAPDIDRRTAIRLLESKDFCGLDLRGIAANDMNLDRLNARGALIRDGHFENTSLYLANFSGSNLSNAHFRGANLQYANFVAADLEGADLAGADLRSANLTNCSLIGASFCDLDEATGTCENGARFDANSVVPEDVLSPLTPGQAQYVRSQLSS